MKNRDTTTHVAMVFDEAYARFAAVTAVSATIHTPGPLHFHFLVNGLMPETRELVASKPRRFGAVVEFHEMDNRQFSGFGFGELTHLSSASYYRISIPQIVAADRCIYLDSDTIVTCDLRPLMAKDLGGAAMGGCADLFAKEMSPMVEVIKDGLYVNSGVMLLDLQQLRAMDLYARASETHREFGHKVRYADQCILNKALDGRKTMLEDRWNAMAHLGVGRPLKPLMEPLDGSAVFHGTGLDKPWMTWTDPWLHALYRSYARLVDLPIDRMIVAPRTSAELVLVIKKLESLGEWKEAGIEKNRLIQVLNDALVVATQSRPPAALDAEPQGRPAARIDDHAAALAPANRP